MTNMQITRDDAEHNLQGNTALKRQAREVGFVPNWLTKFTCVF